MSFDFSKPRRRKLNALKSVAKSMRKGRSSDDEIEYNKQRTEQLLRMTLIIYAL